MISKAGIRVVGADAKRAFAQSPLWSPAMVNFSHDKSFNGTCAPFVYIEGCSHAARHAIMTESRVWLAIETVGFLILLSAVIYRFTRVSEKFNTLRLILLLYLSGTPLYVRHFEPPTTHFFPLPLPPSNPLVSSLYPLLSTPTTVSRSFELVSTYCTTQHARILGNNLDSNHANVFVSPTASSSTTPSAEQVRLRTAYLLTSWACSGGAALCLLCLPESSWP